jgi:predicted dienelactone hydrolase
LTRVIAAIALVALGAGNAAAGPVGVTTRTFIKTSVTTGEPRPLVTVIWYPAVARTGTPEDLGLRDATIRRSRFPLVVFSHGACGRPTQSTYLTLALAKAGFVVAAPAHLGNTADDPDCIAAFIDSAVNRVPDVRFAIDSMLALASDPASIFSRRLRTDDVAVAGLSFGGYTTLAALQQEPRALVGLAMVPGGTAFLGPTDIAQPTMVIGSERDTVVGFAESEHAFERLAGPRFLVELLAANHLSVVDSCYNADLGVSFCVPDHIPQETAHRLVLRYALPFLRCYLAGRRGARRRLTREVDGVVLTAEPRHVP